MPILGVPGYPVSGIIVIDELLRPLIDLWYGRESDSGSRTRARLTRPVVSGLKYREYVRVRMGYVGDSLMASPLPRGSGVVSSFMKADGMLEVPQGTEGYTAGEEIRVRLLTDRQRLKNTLVIIGSHDPLLDELADLIHREDRRLFLSSAHVGSMGGVMAVRRGAAHRRPGARAASGKACRAGRGGIGPVLPGAGADAPLSRFLRAVANCGALWLIVRPRA